MVKEQLFFAFILSTVSSISFNASAQKIAVQGELISADKMNSSMFQIGDIKSSILTSVQFKSINGDCWKLIDGSSLSGTDLGTLTGMANLPNGEGRFLRGAGGNAAALGQLQDEEFKSHTHIQNAHTHIQDAHSHVLPWGPNSPGSSAALNAVYNAIPHTTWNGSVLGTVATNQNATAVNQNSGGVETRPLNLTVNFFIKVNKQCNFN